MKSVQPPSHQAERAAVRQRGNVRWKSRLSFDPIPALLETGDCALLHWVRGELHERRTMQVLALWHLPEAERLLKRQREDGSFRCLGRRRGDPRENYDLLETYRSLSILVEKYGLTVQHPSVRSAAEYVFAHQSPEGDIRGIFGRQYMPRHCAGLLEVLIKAGCGHDQRAHRGLAWFLEHRQRDGGWVWPLRSQRIRYDRALQLPEPVRPAAEQPFSHVLTGIVLRAFAAHQAYRRNETVLQAAELLKRRFFRPDAYPDRRGAHYWTKFQYPYRWTDLLSALDTLALLGYGADDEAVDGAITWFVEHQERDGLWPTGYERGSRARINRLWVGYAAARVFRRLHC